MSTDPFNPSDDPTPGNESDNTTPAGFSPQDTASLFASLADTEFRVQHAEPIVRDLNRNLVQLLGECPNTGCGNWVTLSETDNNVTFHLDLLDVLRISSALAKIGETVALADIRRSIPGRKSLGGYLAEKAALFAERSAYTGEHHHDSVHTAKRKGTGFFGRKGR